MKKLVLFFAVAFAMSFASCGNKAAESTEATDSVAVVEEVAVEVVDTVAADSVAVDSLLLLLNNLQLKQGKNWSYSRARDSSFYF